MFVSSDPVCVLAVAQFTRHAEGWEQNAADIVVGTAMLNTIAKIKTRRTVALSP